MKPSEERDGLVPSSEDFAPVDPFDRAPYRALLECDALKRLRSICFLGAIDYLFHPNGRAACRRHSRLDHSLSVAGLAFVYARRAGLSDNDEQHIVAAALLHDIGHGPLSHSLGPVFRQRFGIGPMEAGHAILCGHAPVGIELRRVLAGHRIDADRVRALIDGSAHEPAGILFRGPINIGTIDAVLRSYGYLSPRPVEASARRVLEAALRRSAEDVRILDRFWELKDAVYRRLIHGPAGLLADLTARRVLERHGASLTPDACYWTDTSLRRALPELFALFARLRGRTTDANPAGCTVPEVVDIAMPRFTVDGAADGRRPERDAERYREITEIRRISVALPEIVIPMERPATVQPGLW
jgi:uncharacterized protein